MDDFTASNSIGGNASDPLLGATVAGRFEIETLIGVGGIGRVYRAKQLELGRAVAIKVLHPEFAQREDMTARFQREARSASMLSHPGSVVVYDFGKWENRLFIAMELLEGRTLTEVLEQEFPLEQARIVNWMTQLCDVLDVAHNMDLLHRDLKPDNIVIQVGQDGKEAVKVVDFGLAILIEDHKDNRLTRDGTVSGTPSYMSPEQALAKELDQRTDLYAVGCIMYEMLCGQPPFDGTSPVDVLAKHLYDEPDSPSDRVRFDIDKRIESCAMWALQKDPDNRPQNAAELRGALERTSSDNATSSIELILTDRQMMKREERQAAVGITNTRRSSRVNSKLGHKVLVFQAPDIDFNTSCVAVLRAQGLVCGTLVSLAKPPDFQAMPADALVVDLRGEGPGILDTLQQWLQLDSLGGRPILVVGPDDSFGTMTRALEIGAADYVPESMLSKLPKKVHRAVRRSERLRDPSP